MSKFTRKPRSRRKLWISLAASVLGLVCLFTLALPWLARRLIESKGSEFLGREVRLESVRINPFEASLTLRDFVVREKDGSALLGFEELYLNADLSSLWGDAWKLDELRVLRPQARVIIDKDGGVNLLSLLPPSPVPAKPTAPSTSKSKPVLVHKLDIIEASSKISDLATEEPFDALIGPLTLHLKDIGTVPSRSGDGELTVLSSLGEKFYWRGGLQASPLQSTGRFSVTNLDLLSIKQYFHPGVGFRLSSGKVNFGFDYVIKLEGNLALQLTKGSFSVDKLSLRDPAVDSPFLAFDRFEMTGIDLDLVEKQVAVAQVSVQKPLLNAVRRKDGSLDVVGFLAARINSFPHMSAFKLEQPGTTTPASEGKPWRLSVPSIEVSNAHARLVDQSLGEPVQLEVDGLGLKLQGFTFPGAATLAVSGSTWLQGAGAANWDGKVSLEPLSADLKVKLEKLSVTGFTPVLKEFVDLDISRGEVSLEGRVGFSLPAQGEPSLNWEGSFALANFAAAAPKQHPSAFAGPRFTLGTVALEDLRFSSNPLSASVGRILVRDPRLQATLLPDRSIDWMKLLKKKSGDAGQPAAAPKAPISVLAAPEKALPPIKITRIDLEGLRFQVDDYSEGLSANPNFSLLLDGFVAGLSSEQLTQGEVDFKGEFCGAPFSMSGQVNPLAKDRKSKVAIRFTGFELPSVSPYAERYMGYKIHQGKMKFDLNYTISEDVLEAENKIQLDRFYLGSETPGPDVVSMPYKLGLALLRDKNGRIDIDIPIRGNLKDPDFRYGKFVWQTVGNMIVKAATSPFKLLGGLVGSSADLSQIDFAPGSADLDDVGTKSLDALGKALQERPALMLEILGQGPAEADRHQLQVLALDTRLRELKLEELKAAKAVPADGVVPELAAEERQRLIGKLYAERFQGEVVAAGLAKQAKAKAAPAPATAKPAAVKPADDRQPGPLVRLWNWVKTGGSSSAAKPAAAPAAKTAAKPALKAGELTAPPSVEAPSLESMEARLLEEFQPAQEELRRLAARRSVRVKSYLEGERKIDPSRLFLIEPDGKDLENGSTLVKFRLN